MKQNSNNFCVLFNGRSVNTPEKINKHKEPRSKFKFICDLLRSVCFNLIYNMIPKMVQSGLCCVLKLEEAENL